MSSYDQIVQSVRQQGERVTIQRELVIEALAATGGHLTIQDVSADIRKRHPERLLPDPTIYRILQKLKELGVISQTDIAERGTVYQVIEPHRHHHLICLNCHAITEIADTLFDDLRTELLSQYHFRARIDHMAIYGYCAVCSPQEVGEGIDNSEDSS